MIGKQPRITDVRTFLVCGGISNWLIVRIATDAGISGIGDATLEGQCKAVAALIETLAPSHVIGRSVFDVEDFVSTVIQNIFWRGGPVLMSAISGLEIAMWDAIGKALDQPIHRLLGGRCRDGIRAYANGWYRTADDPDRFAEDARGVIERGYTALKFDPLGHTFGEFTHASFHNAVEIVQRVRNAVGKDIDLLIENHGRLSPHAARAFLRAIEPFQPYWYEEPVPPEQVDHLRHVVDGSSVRIALGERLFTRSSYRALFRRESIDVVQPDIGHMGGVLEGKKVAAMAESEGIMVAYHTGNSPVITAASLQLDACVPNALIQETFEEFDHPSMRNDLFKGIPSLSNGMLPIPQRPGLGIRFNEDACDRYPYQAHRSDQTSVLFGDNWPKACWEE